MPVAFGAFVECSANGLVGQLRIDVAVVGIAVAEEFVGNSAVAAAAAVELRMAAAEAAPEAAIGFEIAEIAAAVVASAACFDYLYEFVVAAAPFELLHPRFRPRFCLNGGRRFAFPSL